MLFIYLCETLKTLKFHSDLIASVCGCIVFMFYYYNYNQVPRVFYICIEFNCCQSLCDMGISEEVSDCGECPSAGNLVCGLSVSV